MDCQSKIKELRAKTGMNRREFCDFFGIPYRTVSEWERNGRHAPEYVLRLLQFQIETDKVIEKRKKSKPTDVPDKYSDDASDFLVINDVVPDVILDIRYYSTFNFVGERITGYEEPLALLTRETAGALEKVSEDVISKGYRLKIYDAYRPHIAVERFVEWAKDKNDTRMKKYFYPHLDKDVLIPDGYINTHSLHSRGSAVDLTLFNMRTEKEADMGSTFDFFSDASHYDCKGITDEQYANRMLLQETMIKHGFKPLLEEWWHFTLENEPYPDTYFTFPVNSDSLLLK